ILVMASKRLLYAGDGPPEGPAGYLVAILRHLKYSFTHIPPHRFMTREHLRRSYDAFILSDFPRHRMGPGAEEMLSGSVEQGAGLMMVGGWASFAGPFGGWKGSLIERQLPVTCLPGDDRVHLASGGHIFRA
ncbi:MAG: glutamine amidotransferase, partial [Candidatus Omnitrophota bacterium]